MIHIRKTWIFLSHIKKGKEQTIKGDKQNGQKEWVWAQYLELTAAVSQAWKLVQNLKYYSVKQGIVIHCEQRAVNEVISMYFKIRLKHMWQVSLHKKIILS